MDHPEQPDVDKQGIRFRREGALRWIRATGLIIIAFELLHLTGRVMVFEPTWRWFIDLVVSLYLIGLCWMLPTLSKANRRFLMIFFCVFATLRLLSAVFAYWKLLLVEVPEESQSIGLRLLAFPIAQAIVCFGITLIWLFLPGIKEYFRTVDKLQSKLDPFEGTDLEPVQIQDVLDYEG